MESIFDIEFVTSHFGSTNLKHYFDLLKDASNQELKEFKQQVILHSKTNKQRGALLDVPNLSSHNAIILGINYELLKRSWRYKIYKIVFPLRQWLVKTFSGINLTPHETFGHLYIPIKHSSSIWHLHHKELASICITFLRKYLYKTLIAIGTFGVFVLLFIKYINE